MATDTLRSAFHLGRCTGALAIGISIAALAVDCAPVVEVSSSRKPESTAGSINEAKAMTQPDHSEPKYFGSWASYKLPFEPIEPISREIALQRASYYVAYYDEGGQLVRFQKYFGQQHEWTDSYQYWDNGKLQFRHMIKADGSEIHQNFDRKGEIIVDEP